jgi:uncharacterized protein involved in type VI secretion and phage assembly
MTREQEDLLVKLDQQQERLFFGKYRGKVTALDADKMCIRARVPDVLHDEESPWAMPALPFAGPQHGLVLLPEIDDGVWIEFEDRPIWTGCFWAEGKLPPAAGEKVRMLATSADHEIVIDEEKDEIRIVHPRGPTMTMSSGELTITVGQCQLKITESEIILNREMVKVTTAGASLVKDSFKVGG